MLVYLILFLFYGSVAILAINNITTIGFFLYTWSEGASLVQSAWESFILYISVLFLAGSTLLISLLSMKIINQNTSRRAKSKLFKT